MSDLPYAIQTETSYENFMAWCPYCGFKNTFNRVSDLNTTDLISSQEVRCLNNACAKPFNINGDVISPAFEMFVFDCYELKREKRYTAIAS